MTQTWLEVSREAFIYNVNQLKRILGSVKLGLVVKSNGYGHGLAIMAQLAEESDGIACLFTSTTQEALEARESGFSKAIVVMAYYNSPLEEVIKKNIDLVCYSEQMLDELDNAALSVGLTARIHLKIDTGMNRLGIFPSQVDQFLEKIDQKKQIKLVGAMSHCADSSSPDSAFTAQQVERFNRVIKHIKTSGYNLEWVHCCSSGSFLASLDTSAGHTVVRAGSNIYGCWKSATQKKILTSLYPEFDLRQILIWKARIIAIKSIAVGAAIGYGCTFYAESTMTLATVAAGYADGYPRALSNRGYVLVNGKSCPIIGIISMGLLAIDVSEFPDICIGMVVILSNDYTGVCIDDLAQKAGMLNLGILTGLNASLARKIVEK